MRGCCGMRANSMPTAYGLLASLWDEFERSISVKPKLQYLWVWDVVYVAYELIICFASRMTLISTVNMSPWLWSNIYKAEVAKRLTLCICVFAIMLPPPASGGRTTTYNSKWALVENIAISHAECPSCMLPYVAAVRQRRVDTVTAIVAACSRALYQPDTMHFCYSGCCCDSGVGATAWSNSTSGGGLFASRRE